MSEKKYFYGVKISEYGIENNRVDYQTLLQCFDAVDVNNEIVDDNFDDLSIFNGSDYDEENQELKDIYGYYIISRTGAEILQDWTNELVYYFEKYNLYIWGIDHCGTAYSNVSTTIRINVVDNIFEIRDLAEKVRACESWEDCQEELIQLMEFAGLEEEYKQADGENFEDIIRKAQEILRVELL